MVLGVGSVSTFKLNHDMHLNSAFIIHIYTIMYYILYLYLIYLCIAAIMIISIAYTYYYDIMLCSIVYSQVLKYAV